MSFDWTTVKRNTKVIKKPITENPQVRQQQVRPMSNRVDKTRRENEKRAQWEQKRQKKIDIYNAEFPLLPGSKDLVPDAEKIAYINNKVAIKKEADHKAYLEREVRRQVNAKRKSELRRIAEEKHMENMTEKWDTSGWNIYTNDDYDIIEEEDRKWYMEQLEEEYYENQENIRRAEQEAYISEQTANMSEEEKDGWLADYSYRQIEMLSDELGIY
jgi:hypothetical protein